jgi:hypothetical protein
LFRYAKLPDRSTPCLVPVAKQLPAGVDVPALERLVSRSYAAIVRRRPAWLPFRGHRFGIRVVPSDDPRLPVIWIDARPAPAGAFRRSLANVAAALDADGLPDGRLARLVLGLGRWERTRPQLVAALALYAASLTAARRRRGAGEVAWRRLAARLASWIDAAAKERRS